MPAARKFRPEFRPGCLLSGRPCARACAFTRARVREARNFVKGRP
jgi:hypothetical protein